MNDDNHTPAIGPVPQDVSIKDFQSFLGVHQTDRKGNIIEIFGKPTNYGHVGAFGWFDWLRDRFRYDFDTMYYDDILIFSYTRRNRKVMTISCECDVDNVQASLDYIKRFGVVDTKMYFLGQHKDEIIRCFGQPDRLSSDNHQYALDGFHVTFICYDFDAHKCSRINVQFFD